MIAAAPAAAIAFAFRAFFTRREPIRLRMAYAVLDGTNAARDLAPNRQHAAAQIEPLVRHRPGHTIGPVSELLERWHTPPGFQHARSMLTVVRARFA